MQGLASCGCDEEGMDVIVSTLIEKEGFEQYVEGIREERTGGERRKYDHAISRIFEKADLESDNVAVSEYPTNLMGAHGELAPEIARNC
eukprot:scaffold769_cov178-Ochromonas_danica.AAC.4